MVEALKGADKKKSAGFNALRRIISLRTLQPLAKTISKLQLSA
jgi:hypothetical protein